MRDLRYIYHHKLTIPINIENSTIIQDDNTVTSDWIACVASILLVLGLIATIIKSLIQDKPWKEHQDHVIYSISTHCHKGFKYKLLSLACAFTALALTLNETIQFNSHSSNNLLNIIIYVANLISNSFLLIIGVVNTYPELNQKTICSIYTHTVSVVIFFSLKIATNIVWSIGCVTFYKTDKLSIQIHFGISVLAAISFLLLVLTMLYIIIFPWIKRNKNQIGTNSSQAPKHATEPATGPDALPPILPAPEPADMPGSAPANEPAAVPATVPGIASASEPAAVETQPHCECLALKKIRMFCFCNYIIEGILIILTIFASLLQATIANTNWSFGGFNKPNEDIC